MPAKVICVASPKGGSGKTMLVASFSAILADIGKKVLMIDFDAATNGLSLFYLRKISNKDNRRKSCGLYDNSDHAGFNLVEISDNLYLLPATYSFNIEEKNINYEQTMEKIKIINNKVRGEFDYIILDAQAGADTFAEIAMSRSLSDEVIIISEYDPLSAAGVERLKRLFPNELQHERTWILLNKLLPDYVKTFSEFLEIARYLPPIPWEADVVRSYSKRKLAINTEKGNRFTIALIRTLKSLLGEEIETELNDWLENKAMVIKQPIEQQYNDLVNRLEALDKDHREELLASPFKVMLKSGALLCFATALLFILVYLYLDNIIPNNEILKVMSGFSIVIAIILTIVGLANFVNTFITWRERKYEEFKKIKNTYFEELDKLGELKNLNVEDIIIKIDGKT